MPEPTYKIAQRLHERRAAVGLPKYGQHLTANSPGCMLVHAVEEAADLTEYLLAEVQRRKIVLKTLNELSKEMHAELAIGWAYELEKLYDLLGGKSAIEQYDEILGGVTVAKNATVDPRDEALRVAAEALEAAYEVFGVYAMHHLNKGDVVKYAKNDSMADHMDAALAAIRAAGGD